MAIPKYGVFQEYSNRSAVSTSGVLVEAARRLASARHTKIVDFALVFFGAGLLYAIGYHDGSYPLVGGCAAFALGTITPTVVMLRHGALKRGVRQLLADALGNLLLTSAILAPALFACIYGVFSLYASLYSMAETDLYLWRVNEQAYFWKPFWHIALGASLSVAIQPSLLLAWPMAIKTGLRLKDSENFVWRRLQGSTFSRRKTVTAAGLIAAGIAWMPVVCVLIPVFVAHWALVLHQHALTSDTKKTHQT